MSKAYDRVEWPFINGVMSKLGFADGFIDFIICCIKSVQYSILINGEEGLSFRSTRGLRQGDPLSPYLFLFCGEGLSVLMRLACQEGKICGAKVCRASPSITHLMFTDGCILFEEVSNRGISVLKEILREYEVCSGQCVNFEKSTVFSAQMQMTMIGTWCFKFLTFDRLKQRINSWSIRHISQGGREVFIEAVLQAVPTYTMACFLLPKSLCTELENIMTLFGGIKAMGREACIGVIGSLYAR
ncbi:putative Transposon TX1 [Gossypium australe]|uniref:Putative Transposon TX1 n=1 Tax=Gossypium australe TaxID=47621 RepID=A0A5B6X768_9ROSI|nr:putative Transposon TX1 [Gossypium australe]